MSNESNSKIQCCCCESSFIERLILTTFGKASNVIVSGFLTALVAVATAFMILVVVAGTMWTAFNVADWMLVTDGYRNEKVLSNPILIAMWISVGCIGLAGFSCIISIIIASEESSKIKQEKARELAFDSAS